MLKDAGQGEERGSSGEEGGRQSGGDEGDLEVTIISRDGPDKLIVDSGTCSVTFNWTQVTFAVTIQSSQRWFHPFERHMRSIAPATRWL